AASLAWLSLIAAAAIVASSIWSRKRALRAWVILAAWVAAADIAPVLVGRISELGPQLTGLETRYVADATPVLAICLGLAFWPVAGRSDEAGRRWAVAYPGQLGRTVAAGLVGAFVIGSVWSAQAFENVTSSAPDRIYIAHARIALAEAPAGTVIADVQVPQSLMLGIFGRFAYTSQVIEPMETAESAANIRWVASPNGTIDHLMVFADDGRLHEATVFGEASVPMAFGQRCLRVRHGRIVTRFPGLAHGNAEVLHVPYLASVTVGGEYATVSFGGDSHWFTVRQGLNDAYFTVRGTADTVTLSGPAVAGLCVGGLQVGFVVPSASGPVIPAQY
ncbi:MAG TPA: hypothetical protein VGR98_04790, partial [Streptosporangiaceae bacterium]|nr:hypothetical protein [Streptosporangiaceae bacterium]